MHTISFMKNIVNHEMSIITTLERLGVTKPGELSVDRTCFCPFHDNFDTKAAKVYQDGRCISIFCFSEHKLYHTSDAFERFSNYKIETVFNAIWKNLSEEQKASYENEYGGEEDTSVTNLMKEIAPFKSGKMNYSQVCETILNKINS